MMQRTRREFLVDVGRGMLVASVGSTVAMELGLSRALADDGKERITFGSLEPLVTLMQETDAGRLMPLLVERLRAGTDLKQLVAAGALANARTFGGQNYIGYHAVMALPPAYEMARELPENRRALPVLKVLYRNTDNIRKSGGNREILHPIDPAELPEGRVKGELLRESMRRQDMTGTERAFATLVRRPEDAFNDLQLLIQDELNVHRVVLAYRSWELRELTGQQHAHSLLRQSVRFCVQEEQERVARRHPEPAIRSLLPTLLDQHALLERPLGTRKAEDEWVEQLSLTILTGSRDQAAAAVAAALAEGIRPEDVGEAISLAANQLVLRDPGRPKEWASDGKPPGSVHGDSVGVHASDAANAWRNIARISNRRNTFASLIVGAYHTAGQSGRLNKEPYPHAEHREAVRHLEKEALLREADTAIRASDQARACALVHRYGEVGGEPRPVFDLLIRYATSEDGALHAEKYYRTVTEEFARSRPRFRWRQLAALARVTASEYGRPAPGYREACELLKV